MRKKKSLFILLCCVIVAVVACAVYYAGFGERKNAEQSGQQFGEQLHDPADESGGDESLKNDSENGQGEDTVAENGGSRDSTSGSSAKDPVSTGPRLRNTKKCCLWRRFSFT